MSETLQKGLYELCGERIAADAAFGAERAENGVTDALFDEYRLFQLQRTLRLVSEKSPFYRRLFEARGVNPVDVRSLRDLARLPFTTPDELSGGTFTVTNPGAKGNLFGTPIINQPQVGILRMGQVVKRPVVVTVAGEEAIAIRPMMYLCLAYDHRVIDGVEGNGSCV